MALQSTAVISTNLGAQYATSTAQRSLRQFLSANTTFSFDALVPNQSASLAILNRRLALDTTLISVDQSEKARNDIALNVFEGVVDDLEQVKTLIEDTISTPGNAVTNQSQIEAILEGIAANIGSAFKEDPFIAARTVVEGTVTNARYASAQVIRLTDYLGTEDPYTEFDVDFANTGSRSRLSAALDTTAGVAGQFDNTVQFEIEGPEGTSGTITIASGSTVQDAVDAVNDLFDVTGVRAEINTGDANQIDLYSDEFGPQTLTITDLDTGADASAEVTDFATDTSGVDINATAIYDASNGTDFNREFDGSGRSAQFSYLDAQVDFSLSRDTSIVAEAAATGRAFIRVYDGGRQILNDDGSLREQLSIRFSNFATLGRDRDGVTQIDVTTDPTQALVIINQAIEDAGIAVSDATYISETLFANRIATRTARIDSINDNIDEIDTLYDALRVADSARAEASALEGLQALANLSSVFATSTGRLL